MVGGRDEGFWIVCLKEWLCVVVYRGANLGLLVHGLYIFLYVK
jgi:hypothetical protein